MNTAIVSPKYQVVIPKKIRESMGIHPKVKIHFLVFDNSIELIPIKPISTLRGVLKGINTNIERDKDKI